MTARQRKVQPRQRAVLLVDHGSRERAANAQLARVADALEKRLGLPVAVAHLSLAAPAIAEAIGSCVARGAREIVVVPYFLAPGRHATRDVPRLARAAAKLHPGVRVRVAAPLGLQRGLIDAVCERIRGVRRRPVKRVARAASRAGSS